MPYFIVAPLLDTFGILNIYPETLNESLDSQKKRSFKIVKITTSLGGKKHNPETPVDNLRCFVCFLMGRRTLSFVPYRILVLQIQLSSFVCYFSVSLTGSVNISSLH